MRTVWVAFNRFWADKSTLPVVVGLIFDRLRERAEPFLMIFHGNNLGCTRTKKEGGAAAAVLVYFKSLGNVFFQILERGQIEPGQLIHNRITTRTKGLFPGSIKFPKTSKLADALGVFNGLIGKIK